MKVLIVASHLEPRNGWGTEAMNAVRGLLALGHDVTALLHEPYDDVGCTQEVRLPDAMSLLHNPLQWIRTARTLAGAIRRHTPDIVHIMTEPYAIALPLMSKKTLPPVALTCNGTYSLLPLAQPLTRSLMRRAYKRVAHILAISGYTQMRLLKELAKQDAALSENVRGKTSVWTLGIEWPANIPPRRQLPEKQLLFVGAVKPRKGVGEIIEACAVFRRQCSLPFHLHVIGSCPKDSYVDSLRNRLRVLGMESLVTLHGHVSEAQLAQAYADADLFLMLSKPHGYHFEGFGLVFLEANARGVPVIGPSGSGCVEAIADGRSGYVADPDDAAMVAQRMRWILEEGRIRPEDCRTWAAEHSVNRMAKDLEQTYRTMKLSS